MFLWGCQQQPHTLEKWMSLSCFQLLLPYSRQMFGQCSSACIDVHETDDEMMKQWVLAVGKPNLMREGEKKKWKKMKIQRQPRSAISPQHKAAFCRLGSQLRQVECGLIKGRRSGNFYPVAADKRVLFQRLTWFLWEKCENLDWQKEARCFFSPSPILWLFLVVGRLRPILDAGSKKTRHKTTPEDW